MWLSHSLYDIVPYHRALASFIALKLFTTAKRWLPLLLWNYSPLQSTSFLCCFETIHHCKALASFVAFILINAKRWLPLLLWNYSSLQSTGFSFALKPFNTAKHWLFCCCFETIHHCKALASFVALILINAKLLASFAALKLLITAKHWLCC